MIEFLTLFLGIAAGPQEVRVAVADSVAAVELRLDEQTLSRRTSEPWHFSVDLGPDPLPRRLSAVALDSAGNEIRRAEQVLNVPRAAVEVALTLIRDGRELKEAHISWETAVADQPDRIRPRIDGVSVPLLPGNRVDLSALDPARASVLHVELDFEGVLAHRFALLGGERGADMNTVLTAWPMLVDGRGPKLAQISDWFRSDGQRLRPVALETGPVSLAVVRSPEVAQAIMKLPGRPASRRAGRSAGIGPLVGRAVASTPELWRRALPLGSDLLVRLLIPRSIEKVGQQVDYGLFSVSPELAAQDGGLLWALSLEVGASGQVGPVRVGDAVAIAGLQTAATNRRRAVLLVLGEDWQDQSRFSAAAVRGYLYALNVPLFVWRVGEGTRVGREWGHGEHISNYADLKRAWRAFGQRISRQRVVWLEGSHLPNEVELAESARASTVND